jgi:uncharacterized RDD family membrane protein YckC
MATSAPAVAAPPLAQPAVASAVAAPAVLYAGFWLRVVAAIIDGFVLAIPSGLVFFLLMASALPFLMRSSDPMTVMITILPRLLMLLVIYLAGSWLYWALMESSARQATLGKMALGLYVTDLAGNRATFGRTSGRFFAGRGISMVPYLGGLYFLISCIMAGFTEKKQALHDMIANCLVLRKA